MNRLILTGLLSLSTTLFSLEKVVQFENHDVCISKVTVDPHEEIGPHRDAYPRLIVVLEGGVYKRIEASGESAEFVFKKGDSTYLEADKEGELHTGINLSDEPIVLLVMEMKKDLCG